MKKVIIIGSGFAGLSASCFMAKAGWEVTVIETHSIPGGRARVLQAEGFSFDMGPSWYWMPDVFERFFHLFGKKVENYYHLDRLNPSYRVYWPDACMDVPANYDDLKKLFEQTERGSSVQLDLFMEEAAYKYKVGIHKLVFKPGQSVVEFLDKDLVMGLFKLDVFTSIKKHIAKHFKNPRLQQLMEFPALFLGALPSETPALYSLMNYADVKLGTWYPQGGIYKVVDAIHSLARELGVQFRFEEEVSQICIDQALATGVHARQKDSSEKYYEAHAVIAAGDYEYIEMNLLSERYRTHTKKYWSSRVMAPSCLIYYIGLGKKLPGVLHHTLFFDTSFAVHGIEIYKSKIWPTQPLFYCCVPSVTDDTVAPPGCENLFFLIPIAAGLEGDTEDLREAYFQKLLQRFEALTGHTIQHDIIYKKSYSVSNFAHDYHSFKGNAYGLANTLLQTAVLKPSCRSNKIKNLFYTGQLTIPGPGVPPSLISGEVVATEMLKYFN